MFKNKSEKVSDNFALLNGEKEFFESNRLEYNDHNII